jgi:hypothetical protein
MGILLPAAEHTSLHCQKGTTYEPSPFGVSSIKGSKERQDRCEGKQIGPGAFASDFGEPNDTVVVVRSRNAEVWSRTDQQQIAT